MAGPDAQPQHRRPGTDPGDGQAAAPVTVPGGWFGRASGQRRVVVVAFLGVLGGLGAAAVLPVALAALLGWDLAAVALVGWVWLAVGRLDPEQTRSVATLEDNSRVARTVAVVAASVASLLGAGVALAASHDLPRGQRTAVLAACAGTVLLSWLVVQTEFALHYARQYYRNPLGGIDFGRDQPDYGDFAYLAFTVGMTFQISDTTITNRTIRRTVTRHALLAYLFGAIILAVMVNVIAGLVN